MYDDDDKSAPEYGGFSSGAGSYFGGGYTGDGFSGVGSGGYKSETSGTGGESTGTPSTFNGANDSQAANEALGLDAVTDYSGSTPDYGGFSSSSSTPSWAGRLSNDDGMAKAMWAGLSADERRAVNSYLGRPADYNAIDAEKSLRDKVFDATNPEYGSKAYAFGLRGMGVNFDQVAEQEAQNPGMQSARMRNVGNVLNNIGNAAIQMTPGGGAAMTFARAINAVDKGMPLADAAKSALFDVGGRYAAGAINRAAMGQVAGALGGDAARALAGYNGMASVVNMGAPGTLPSFNPGGQLVGAAGRAMGVQSLGVPSGVTLPSGDAVTNSASMPQQTHGGGYDQSPAAPIPIPIAPAATVPQAYDATLDLDGLQWGRQLRSNVIQRFGGRK